uniref:dolichyl-diphosphooligosaccharide--protein glycosyltransferase subunit DAD1 isoform X2 n=1 Tax=Jaculus jaculus TaxID=51337 RepID=UPI001E1B1DFF|nr:dolichyl-diphosphooligosaccharide--protein glycosyltransferase subunit DAD1 isoform X2 [Jaculus jaculus]
MSASVVSVISRFLEEYLSSTPQRLKLLDAYLLYILLTGALQFGYCLLVGTFPFNSFLSGFISCVGSFILAGSHFDVPWIKFLRWQPVGYVNSSVLYLIVI